jgi:hypothetical protein
LKKIDSCGSSILKSSAVSAGGCASAGASAMPGLDVLSKGVDKIPSSEFSTTPSYTETMVNISNKFNRGGSRDI